MWRASVLSILLAAAVAAASADVPLAVIVHPSRSAPLDKSEIERIYLKKKRYWGDGTPIVPINRETGSEIRSEFNRRVYRSRAVDLARYWNQLYFQGILPPITLSSDEAVKRYVATERNAIGYVRADDVDDSVRVVLILE